MLKRILRITLIVLLVLALAAGGVYGWYFFFVENINTSITVEAGTKVSAEDFKIWPNSIPAAFAGNGAAPDLSEPGTYPVQISYYDRSYESTLVVEDTQAPRVTTQDLTRYSTEPLEPRDFIVSLQDNTQVSVEYTAKPNMEQEGVQEVKLAITDQGGNVTECVAQLTVIVDNTPPAISGAEDRLIYLGSQVDVLEGISVADDKITDPTLTVDDGGLDPETPGEYIVTYMAGDENGNYTAKAVLFSVIEDKEGPVILGVNTLSAYQGSTISYRAGVLVTDNQDPNPTLKIDNSDVDLTKPGTYDVVYIATDEAGNETKVETTITIKQQTANYVQEDVIYAKADELLASIIEEDMTDIEKVFAVHDWARYKCKYSNGTDKTDRLQAAYLMMTKQTGDCYSFFSVCSLLFDRLGFPNIEVRRSPNSVSRLKHFWNLVSIDGGQTYYHVDSCPTMGTAKKICMSTDADLEAINARLPGHYTMEPGVYPATPTTSPVE